METVSIDDVELAGHSDVDCRKLSAPLGATGVAVNRYRLAPGEGFPGGLHAHADQEEVFVVLSGAATFETYLPESDGAGAEAGEVTVAAGEAVRFAPGEFQSGRNEADGELVALALGAPRDSADVRLPLRCPACDHPNLRLETSGAVRFVCPDCGAARTPRSCPACGRDALRTALDEAFEVVVACRACEAEFEDAPLADVE